MSSVRPNPLFKISQSNVWNLWSLADWTRGSLVTPVLFLLFLLTFGSPASWKATLRIFVIRNETLNGRKYFRNVYPSFKGEETRQVSSMIHSTRPTVIASSGQYFRLIFVLFRYILKSGEGRTDGQHVRKQWSLLAVTVGWVGLEDQNVKRRYRASSVNLHLKTSYVNRNNDAIAPVL